jgi:hypothetical protein
MKLCVDCRIPLCSPGHNIKRCCTCASKAKKYQNRKTKKQIMRNMKKERGEVEILMPGMANSYFTCLEEYMRFRREFPKGTEIRMRGQEPFVVGV